MSSSERPQQWPRKMPPGDSVNLPAQRQQQPPPDWHNHIASGPLPGLSLNPVESKGRQLPTPVWLEEQVTLHKLKPFVA